MKVEKEHEPTTTIQSLYIAEVRIAIHTPKDQ